MKKLTFNEFCAEYLDRMYEPRLLQEQQSTGYLQLRKMVVENVTPASLSEMVRWENNPTDDELFSIPDIKYLRFLHPLLRPIIVENWSRIKRMEIE